MISASIQLSFDPTHSLRIQTKKQTTPPPEPTSFTTRGQLHTAILVPQIAYKIFVCIAGYFFQNLNDESLQKYQTKLHCHISVGMLQPARLFRAILQASNMQS